jgi:dimeric dUTPase (all-alpha-NTP-PPase superfamily)
MNLEKLFAAQKVLMDRIEAVHPTQPGEDRFNKRILGLYSEIGECLNEWREFKFWSVNQLSHTSAVRVPTMIEEDKVYYNPLLEEYVDGLHFVLELGIVKKLEFYANETWIYQEKSINEQFIKVYQDINTFLYDEVFYLELLNSYIGLGIMLGFTWEEIEQAYLDKNKVNHQRQDGGY